MPPHPVLKWERNGNCPAVRQGAMSRGAEVAPLRRPRDGGQHRPQKLAVSSDGTRAPGQPRRSGEGGRGAPPRRRPNALGHTGAGSVLPARCQRSKPRNHHGHRAAPAAPPPPSLPAESPGVVGAVLRACSVAGASARPGAEADRSPGPSRGSRAGRVRCRSRCATATPAWATEVGERARPLQQHKIEAHLPQGLDPAGRPRPRGASPGHRHHTVTAVKGGVPERPRFLISNSALSVEFRKGLSSLWTLNHGNLHGIILR